MSNEPSYIGALRDSIPGASCVVHGCAERWAAPVAIFDTPNGFGEETWDIPVPDTAIAWLISGGDVVSELPGSRGRRVSLGEHKINLQPRDAESRYHASSASRFGHFYISDALLSRVAQGLDLPDFGMPALRHDLIMIEDREFHRQLNHYARRTNDVRLPPSRVEMEALALLLVEHLVTRHHTGHQFANIRGGLAPWQIKRTCEAMMERLNGDLGLDDLAAIAGCSPTHFSRAFKQSIGLAPFHWLNEQRIEKAKELLENSRLSLAEIALAVGFSAQPQFTTAFGRATGLTPGAWRKQRHA